MFAVSAINALGNLIQIPGWIFPATAVPAPDEAWGGMVAYTAAGISCIVTVFTIRCVGGNALRKPDDPLAVNLTGLLDANPVKIVILPRMLFQPVPALSHALAMTASGFAPTCSARYPASPCPSRCIACLLSDAPHCPASEFQVA